MEVLNAIFEVANTTHALGLVPTEIIEPEANCGLITSFLNSDLIQLVWGWTKSVPILGKYLLIPILMAITGLYWFGMAKMGSKALKWIISAVFITLVVLMLPTVLEGTNIFGSCG